MRLRVATYNIHKCRGMDGRTSPARVAEVLREVDADVVALQEVVNHAGGPPETHQGHFLAAALGLELALGSVRLHRGADYGNVVLSRSAIHACRQHDLTVPGREPRGCLQVDVAWRCETVHILNVHLGTSFLERRQQGPRLVRDVLEAGAWHGPRVVLGDFNEWTRGLASHALAGCLRPVNLREHARFGRSYPALLPVLHLDNVYHDPVLRLVGLRLHRSRTALVASDHLPLVAEFELDPGHGC